MIADLVASRTHLPPQQARVCLLLALGRSVKEIGTEMQLSSETVKDYVKRIYRRLDVHSRSELVDLLCVLLTGASLLELLKRGVHPDSAVPTL